jgi:hypothetical protein
MTLRLLALSSFPSVFRIGVHFVDCIMENLWLGIPGSARKQNVGLTGMTMTHCDIRTRTRNRRKKGIDVSELRLCP